MGLTTIVFAIFSILTIIIYFVVPKKIQWIILLLSSMIFLFYKNVNLATIIQALLILSTTYICSLLIHKYKDNQSKSKLWLIIGILLIIGVLFYLKYINLFLVTLNSIGSLFHLNFHFNMVNHVSLIGISYYSLIMIGYLNDVYRGACEPQRNIFKCALFMSYFPILTSGPFIRYNNLKDDLYGTHKFSYDRMCSGLVRVLWGLFKILVISLRLGIIVDSIYNNLNSFNGLIIVVAILAFPLQLYTNFSGSIDIIMGISEIMGIQLPENFNAPFFSKTITEFWRNWHITLGAWLKDYVFYPLLKSDMMQNLTTKCKTVFGKKIGKKIPMFLSMLIMWILIGIWHGGEYKFIVGTGLLQFLYIFLEDLLEPVAKRVNKKLRINDNSFWYKTYQILRTYLLFSFAMIFFRSYSISEAVIVIKSIFSFKTQILSNIKLIGLDIYDWGILLFSLIILFIVDFISRKTNIREKLFKKNIIIRWMILYFLIFSIIVFGCYGDGFNPADFIYRGF